MVTSGADVDGWHHSGCVHLFVLSVIYTGHQGSTSCRYCLRLWSQLYGFITSFNIDQDKMKETEGCRPPAIFALCVCVLKQGGETTLLIRAHDEYSDALRAGGSAGLACRALALLPPCSPSLTGCPASWNCGSGGARVKLQWTHTGRWNVPLQKTNITLAFL